jgi:hypothetical protein
MASGSDRECVVGRSTPTLRAILCTIARSPGRVCAGAAIDCHALGVQTETVAKAVFV